MRLIIIIAILMCALAPNAHARGSGSHDYEGFFGAFIILFIVFIIYIVAKKINGGGQVSTIDFAASMFIFMIIFWIFGFLLT
jgi:hypothetical protein